MKWSALILCLASACAFADDGVPPPPAHGPADTLRIWHAPAMHEVAQAWRRGFSERHPQVRVVLHSAGSDEAMARLYTGQADIALIGRAATDSELKAFEWVFRYPPTAYPLLSGSLDQPGQSPALAILVHRDNPLRRISLAQLARVFGRNNDDSDIDQWPQLGVALPAGATAISLYGPMMESGTGRHFRQRVLAGSNRVQWTRFTEFDEPVLPAGRTDTAGQRAAAALARDPAGMAIGELPAAGSAVIALQIVDAHGDTVALDREAIISGRYPLARQAHAYVNQAPAQALHAPVADFLAYATSPAGQRVVESTNSYLPLGDALLQAQHARLEAAAAATPTASGTPP